MYKYIALLLLTALLGCGDVDLATEILTQQTSDAIAPQRYTDGDILLDNTGLNDRQREYAMSENRIFFSNENATVFHIFDHSGSFVKAFTRERVKFATMFDVEKGERSDDRIYAMNYISPYIYVGVSASPAPTFGGRYFYVFDTDGNQVDHRRIKDPLLSGNTWWKMKPSQSYTDLEYGDLNIHVAENHLPLFGWQGHLYRYNKEYEFTRIKTETWFYSKHIPRRLFFQQLDTNHRPTGLQVDLDHDIAESLLYQCFDYNMGIVYKSDIYHNMMAFSVDTGAKLFEFNIGGPIGYWTYINDSFYRLEEYDKVKLECYRY